MAVHIKTYAVSRPGVLSSADVFLTVGYSNADVCTFCCKNQHRIFQNLQCVHTDRREGRGIEPVLTFFWTREGQFFMILCRLPLWTPPEQKKTVKLSIGYRHTSSNTKDSLYRVCIKSLWLYHDHLHCMTSESDGSPGSVTWTKNSGRGTRGNVPPNIFTREDANAFAPPILFFLPPEVSDNKPGVEEGEGH